MEKVHDKYVGDVRLLEMPDTVRLDQEFLSTVIPQIDRPVLVVNGEYSGERGVLKKIEEAAYCGLVQLNLDGEEALVQMPYEDFSKLHE